MNTKKHYLSDLLNYLKLSASAFAKSIGYESPNRIYYILRFRNGVSKEVAKDITNVYPDVNYNWLITGEGNMLKSDEETYKGVYIGNDNHQVAVGNNIKNEYNAVISKALKKKLEDYDQLKKDIFNLEKENKLLKHQIELYEKLISEIEKNRS